MMYPSEQLASGNGFQPYCPADVYVRMKAAVIAARVAKTLSEHFDIVIEAPKKGVGDWFRTNVGRAAKEGILSKEQSIDLLADFNSVRMTSKISQFALSKSGLNYESFYLPLSDEHGKRAAGHLQRHLTGLTDFMNASEAHRSTNLQDKHYIDDAISFSSTDEETATYGNFNQAKQVGHLGNGFLFLNSTGYNSTVHGKELIVICKDSEAAVAS